MSCDLRTLIVAIGFLPALIMTHASPAAADQLYAPTSADDARSQTLQWVARQDIQDERILGQIGKLWADAAVDSSPRLLLDIVIATFALSDPQTEQFIAACDLAEPPLSPPRPTLLGRPESDEFYTRHVRLFYARYLAQLMMYDEALAVFEQIDPATVVDPATCLFYKAVCQHELLMKKETQATLEALLKNTENVPVAYSSVASLMQYELEGLRDESLGEVARKMKDSGRRLHLGRGGQRVRKVQDEIVDALDAIIKKVEQQSGGGGGGGGSGQNNSNRSSGPADDSRVKGNTAPGEVDPKRFRKTGGWGSLPPKEETRAKNLLKQNFPSHYRRAVEQYFKKLAKRRSD